MIALFMNITLTAKSLALSLPLAALVGKGVAHAQTICANPPCPGVDITGPGQLLTTINRVIDWAFVFFFAVAVFFFLWAAFDYLTAAGDAAKLTSAKNRLIYGIIGVALALIAKSIPVFVKGFIQA